MPGVLSGIVLALVVGTVIIGGIKRIGAVAGRLVPFMCSLYLLAALYVVVLHLGDVPAMLRLIVVSAFSPAKAQGAFLGGTVGYAFLWGMKRALFSNEAGQGSAPIAHSAAKTNEPVREGVVAGLEPFIDTLVVCTLTTLVILLSGAWNRGPEARFAELPTVVGVAGAEWTLETPPLPLKNDEQVSVSEQWQVGDGVFMLLRTRPDSNTASDVHRINGTVRQTAIVTLADGSTVQGRIAGEEDGAVELATTADGVVSTRVFGPDQVEWIDRQQFVVDWDTFMADVQPSAQERGVYGDYVGAYLTGHAFDRVTPGLGRWLVTFAAWLFRHLHHDFVGLLRGAGRRLSGRRAPRAAVQGGLLTPGHRRDGWLDHPRDRARQSHRPGHGFDALREYSHHAHLRRPGDECVSRLLQPISDR